MKSDPFTTYSKRKLDKIGKNLKEIGSATDQDSNIFSEWRALHSYPLNTFQSTLRDKIKALKINKERVFISQRLKRINSIIGKLRRFKTMKLSQMQDIGGLRVVLESIEEVYKLKNHYQKSKFSHELREPIKDYIKQPKNSGYRGIHLVYQYKKKDSPLIYNGLFIEIQIRTNLQHQWATAVETMGIYLETSLKSSQGSKEWLDYFALVSSVFAIEENKPVLEQHKGLTIQEIYKKINQQTKNLKVFEKLSIYNKATDFIIHKNTHNQRGRKGNFYLIYLFFRDEDYIVHIESYSRQNLVDANSKYIQIEKAIKERDDKSHVVLVNSSSFQDLRNCYPNYFLDTKDFLKNLRKLIDENTP